MPDALLDPRFGFALPDGMSLKGGGWAACAGAPAFRYAHAAELDPACLWITPIESPVFTLQSGRRFPQLRSGSFMTTPLRFVMEEMGVWSMTQTNPAEVARLMSQVVSRMMRLACQEYPSLRNHPDCQPLLQTRSTHDDKSLAELLFDEVAGPPPVVPSAPGFVEAVRSIFSAPAYMQAAQILPNTVTVWLPAHRVRQAHTVLNESMVPHGRWYVHKGRIDVDAPSGPALFRISLSNPDPAVACLLPRHCVRGRHLWVAQPELIVLANLMTVTVESALIAEEAVLAGATFRRPMFPTTPIDRISVSAGLLAEACMTACCIATPMRDADLTTEQSARLALAPRSAWLASTARAEMLMEAARLVRAGFAVIGHGLSHVMISLPRSQLATRIPALLKAIEHRNLVAPAHLAHLAALAGEGSMARAGSAVSGVA